MKKLGLGRLGLAVLLVALAACASDDTGTTTPPPVATPPPLPVAPLPPPVASAPPVQLPPPDQCGAYELADLVGKPRTSIPVPINPSKRRVVCSTCPTTMDFSPDRLTITYDAGTGLVTKVQCG